MSRAPSVKARPIAADRPHRREAELTWYPGPNRAKASHAIARLMRNHFNDRPILDLALDELDGPELRCPEVVALGALARIELDVEPELDVEVRGNVSSGNAAADKKSEDEILNRLNRGDVWAWCQVRVKASLGPHVAYSDWCGATSCANSTDYERPGGYYDGQRLQALHNLLKLVKGEAS